MESFIHNETSTVALLKFWIDKQLQPTLSNERNYLSTVVLVLINISERNTRLMW